MGPPPAPMETGLHAKTVILDGADGESITVTGSANITQSAWTRNVEFDVILWGPTATTGVDAVLDGGGAPIGLRSITEPFTPEHEEPETDAERAVRYRIEHFHRELARRRPVLDVMIVDDNTVSVRLDLDVPDDALSANTTVWLQSVAATARGLESEGVWTVAPVNVTRFLAVETTADVDGTAVTRRCILTCALSGDPIDRRRAALAAILSSPRSVLLYLAMLLGLDPNDAVLAADAQGDGSADASLTAASGEPTRCGASSHRPLRTPHARDEGSEAAGDGCRSDRRTACHARCGRAHSARVPRHVGRRPRNSPPERCAMTDERPDLGQILSGLKPFQLATVEHVFARLWGDGDTVDRFLVADEVGLGKTLVAKGVAAKAIDHLWDSTEETGRPITIVYICSNHQIARQNLARLSQLTEGVVQSNADRLTLLPLSLREVEGRRVQVIAFTPGTSLALGRATGKLEERALLKRMLTQAFPADDFTDPSWISYLAVGASEERFAARVAEFEKERRSARRPRSAVPGSPARAVWSRR